MTLRMEPGISLVAVIRIDRTRPVSDLDRFVALALPSFKRFLSPDLLRELIVVVPGCDVAVTRRRLNAALSMDVRVLDEKEIIPHLRGAMPGWVKQQIIKLAMPEVLQTPWFITLDADVLAARPIDQQFLVPGGRAIWQQERAAAHMDWWHASASILGSPVRVEPDTPVFGVTPAIMHAPSLVDLGNRISQKYPGKHWTQTLMDLAQKGWTEYSLYWTHLLDTATADTLYADVERHPYALHGSVWTANQLATHTSRDRLESVFASDAPHAFYVFQSNLERPLSETVRLLRPFVEGRADVSVAERMRWEFHRMRSRAERMANRLRARMGAQPSRR